LTIIKQKDETLKSIAFTPTIVTFYPITIGLFLYEDFGKMIFWLVLELEISYNILKHFLKLIFLHGETFEFPKFFFSLMIYLKCKWEGHNVSHPL